MHQRNDASIHPLLTATVQCFQVKVLFVQCSVFNTEMGRVEILGTDIGRQKWHEQEEDNGGIFGKINVATCFYMGLKTDEQQ